MKYSVGYRIYRSDDYVQALAQRKDKIEEIYFSWGDFPNGRNNQLRQEGFTAWEAQQKQMNDLRFLSENGLKFNLLFNGNCYGKDSQSRAFFEKIGETVDYIKSQFGLGGITTTSILIAKFIKNNFSDIDVRASVNMSIGTEEGIDYVSGYFDSFYLKRELNRNFSEIKKLKTYCEQKGKKLYALANSGCLNYCSAHTFHDNLVAHESGISKMDNGYHFEGVCKEHLRNPENTESLFNRTNFIRPEDMHLYEPFFTSVKLATRVNAHPLRILRAYLDKEKHSGCLLSLMEPDHSGLIYPYVLENQNVEAFIKDEKLIYRGELLKLDSCAMLE